LVKLSIQLTYVLQKFLYLDIDPNQMGFSFELMTDYLN